MNNMMPGGMPQGSQNSFMQPQPTMYGQGFPAVPGVSGVQAARPRTIPGRMIYSPDEIMPQEVPMDGSVSLFQMHDWSCVYGKWWTSNGQIQTVKFVLEQPKKQIDESAVSLSNISERHRKCKTEPQRRLYGLVPCECDRGNCSNTCTARFGSWWGCHAGNDYDIYPGDGEYCRAGVYLSAGL